MMLHIDLRHKQGQENDTNQANYSHDMIHIVTCVHDATHRTETMTQLPKCCVLGCTVQAHTHTPETITQMD